MILANALVVSTDHIVLPCKIASKILFNTIAIVDCGATALFINFSFAQLHGLEFSQLQHPQDLTVADGRTVSSRAITHTVRIFFTLETHVETFELFVTTLSQYPVVLGLSWLRKHDLRICFSKNTVTFDSKRCLDHCINTHQPMTIRGADNTFDTLHKSHKTPQTHETLETHRTTAPKP